MARLITGPLTEKLGQTVVVDNRPGGGATIGAAMVATAPADGYTLMLSNTTPISISPFMLEKPTYDGVTSFTHMFYIGSVPNIFVVHPSVPARNMKELVTFIRGQKDAVNYGSGGIGSIGHIIGELFKKENKLRMEHVGYRGSGPMHTDLIGGQIPMAVDSFPQNVPYMQSGKLRGPRGHVDEAHGARAGSADRDRSRHAEAGGGEFPRYFRTARHAGGRD